MAIKSVFSVTSLYTLNYFWETVMKFFVIFWYIILYFLQYFSSSLDLGYPLFLSLSRKSHTASVIFKSGLCRGQSMTVSVLSAVFLSKYYFTGISSVLGIIVIPKNFKTIPKHCYDRKGEVKGKDPDAHRSEVKKGFIKG